VARVTGERGGGNFQKKGEKPSTGPGGACTDKRILNVGETPTKTERRQAKKEIIKSIISKISIKTKKEKKGLVRKLTEKNGGGWWGKRQQSPRVVGTAVFGART